MSWARARLITALLLLQESAWLVALFGVLGLMFGAGGSPLSWLAVLAVMAVSLVIARTLAMIVMPILMAYGLQMIAGVIVVYLAVASQASMETQGVNLAWISLLGSDDATQMFTVRAILGSFLGVALWWRGGQIGAADFPAETLSASFKIGILALALAAVIDIANSTDLNVFPMMFLFFASGVAGLSIAHMAPASHQTSTGSAWARLIGGIVAVVVALGLLFSLLQRAVLDAIAAPILWALELLLRVVFYVIIVPIAYIYDFIAGALLAFLLRVRGEPEQEMELTMPGAVEGLQGLQSGEAEPAALLLLTIIQWSVVIAIIIGVLLVMALAFKRRSRQRGGADDGQRESVREDADVAYDLANLLFGLLPSRFRKKQESSALRVPTGDPNITDVFRIYFGLLVLAEKRGNPRQPSETPREYQRTLEGLFPRELARAATAAFMRACYGHHPAPREDIEEMRSELERVSESKPE